MTVVRLSDEQVRRMREAFAAGARQTDLAAEYGVGQNTVSSIVRGKTRADAGGPISAPSARKLSDADVDQIRQEVAAGTSQRALAERFGVSRQLIGAVVAARALAPARSASGSVSPSTAPRSPRLSATQVDEILARSAAEEPRADLAAAFGVSVWSIDAVRRGRTRGSGASPRSGALSDAQAQSIREAYGAGASRQLNRPVRRVRAGDDQPGLRMSSRPCLVSETVTHPSPNRYVIP